MIFLTSLFYWSYNGVCGWWSGKLVFSVILMFYLRVVNPCHQISPDNFYTFVYAPFTHGLRSLCLLCATTKLTRSLLGAQRMPKVCLDRSRVAPQDVQTSPWTPCSPWNFGHVQNSRTKVAEEVGHSQVAQRRKRKARTSPWSQNGCIGVDHWSPIKLRAVVNTVYQFERCFCLHCSSFGRLIESLERSLWRPLCLDSTTTATLESPWQWFCLHSASFARPVVPLQQFWWSKESTRIVLQWLHRSRTFWVWATTERPDHFPVTQRWHEGHSPVERGLQRCLGAGLYLFLRSWALLHETKRHDKSKGGNFVLHVYKTLFITLSLCWWQCQSIPKVRNTVNNSYCFWQTFND